MNDMKTPPNNVDAERAVLGSILLDTTGRDERVMDVCQSAGVIPETFFDPRNRAIYKEMMTMARASRPLDALTLTEELSSSGHLEAVGGAAYIQSLIDQFERRRSLSPRQVMALRRVIVAYKDKIPGYDEVAGPLGLDDIPSSRDKKAKVIDGPSD